MKPNGTKAITNGYSGQNASHAPNKAHGLRLFLGPIGVGLRKFSH